MKPFFLSLGILTLVVSTAFADGMEKSIVEVIVTSQRPDARLPWRRERPVMRVSYGTVVAPGRILTTEDTVRNATLVEVQSPGQATKYTARVIRADARIGTALLAIPEELAGRFTPVTWDGVQGRGASVTLAQFDKGAQLQTANGRVAQTSVSALPSAPHAILTLSILSDLKLERIGAPVFANGRLTGMVIRYDAANQIIEALPSGILKRFSESAASSNYQGFASAGLRWAPMLDPAKRRYYGLKDDNLGVTVLRTIPGSGASKSLEADDVILRWDGSAIDSHGFYLDPEYGRLNFPHLITRRTPGESVSVTVFRNRQETNVTVTLDAFDDSRALIPLNTEGIASEYLIEGGLLIRELTADYLTSAGKNWMVLNSPQLINLYLTRAQFPEKPGQRVVILVGILPDDINKGYEMIRDQIVTHVNGKPVASMKDVFAIRKADGGVTRVTMQNLAADVMLDPEVLAQANRRIAENYRIPGLMLEHKPN